MRAAISRLRERPADAGVTIVELLVAMGIFSVVIAVFMGAVVTMSNSTVRSQVVSDTASQLRTVFQRLDKEVRYASDINTPGTVNGRIYVEYLVPASTATGAPLCVQWRYVTATRELQRRTASPGVPSSATGWATMVTDLRNDLSVPGQQPFVVTRAGNHGSIVYLRQTLDVYLDAGLGAAGSGEGGQLDVRLVARNSSTASNTNNGSAVCAASGLDRS